MEHRYYRTGELARLTSVSVRTLRHYDRLGLVTPSGRTEAGYRLYCDADLVRLQQVLALKLLGFSLAEIKACLDGPPRDAREALAQQAAMLREQRARLDSLIQTIERAERVLRANGHRDGRQWDALVEVIRAIQMEQQGSWRKKYFTDEQLATMDELSRSAYSEQARERLAAREWTEQHQQQIDEQYNALYAGVKRAVAEGQDPSSPVGQALAEQAIGLLEAFTGGDPEIEAGLRAWWSSHDALPAEQRPYQSPLSDAESAFLEEAKRIYNEHRSQRGGA